MISLYGLFILLLAAKTIHAQDVTSLPLGADDLKLLTTLKESNTPDQSDTSAPADPQSEEECKEAQYFESEYSGKKELSKGKYGAVYLATRKSDGLKVVYKSIPRTDVREYTLELIPPPRYHPRNPTVRSKKPPVEQCISSRPQNLLLPHEFALQMYLSRPGHENPHVPEVFDYIILEDNFILVMEYFDEKWVSLSSYVEEKGQLDIDTIRSICREILNGMLSLKRHGVAHDDLHGMSQ
ncbi:hypothetical protein BASA61_008115 [Batrachochytrium salamandrivorans]|nr:hypothetical protein BASA61_008115 [Batrachochytrium salamandrivorans]